MTSHVHVISNAFHNSYDSFRANKDSYRFLHLGQLSEMLNQVVRGHKAASPDCDGLLDWDMGAEDRSGLATILRMRWMTCDYGSTKYKLYQIVDTKAPGWKAANSNLGLQIGLSQTPLGNDGIRKILLSTNTPAPSRKALQKSSNPEQNYKEHATLRRSKAFIGFFVDLCLVM